MTVDQTIRGVMMTITILCVVFEIAGPGVLEAARIELDLLLSRKTSTSLLGI